MVREAIEELELLPRETCSGSALTLLEIVVPTLLPYKLESGDGVTIYNLQWVLHQYERGLC